MMVGGAGVGEERKRLSRSREKTERETPTPARERDADPCQRDRRRPLPERQMPTLARETDADHCQRDRRRRVMGERGGREKEEGREEIREQGRGVHVSPVTLPHSKWTGPIIAIDRIQRKSPAPPASPKSTCLLTCRLRVCI